MGLRDASASKNRRFGIVGRPLLMIMMTILMMMMTMMMMLMLMMTMILCKLPISEAVVDVNGNMAGSLGFLLVTNSSWGPSTNCGGIAPIIFIGA